MFTEINFSVIIPHKNSPDLLQRCLDSIPSESDIEVIVIDDASDSEVVDFTNFPGIDSPGVNLIFSKEKKGAGFSRNLGLQEAKGKWVIFADADDFFEPKAFEAFSKYLNTTADLIYFGVNSKFSSSLEPADRADYFQDLLHGYKKGDKNSEDWLRLRYLVPWGKMIRRDFIESKKLRFEEIVASNDIMFSVRSGSQANSIDVDYTIVYCVTMAKGSLTNTRSREIALTRYKVKLRFNDYVRKLGKSKYQYPVRREIYDALQYGGKEFLLYLRLAFKHRTDFFFALNLKRAIESRKKYQEEEKKKGEYIIRK